MLSDASSAPASVSVQSSTYPHALEHTEHAVELAGQAFVATLDPPFEARDVAREPLRLPRPAQRGVDPGRTVQRMSIDRDLQFFHRAVGVDGHLRLVEVQAPQRVDHGALERLAARRERPWQLDRRDLADRTPKIARCETHERTTLGEREDPSAAAPLFLFEDDRLAAPLGCDDDVAGAETVDAIRFAYARRAPGGVDLGEQAAVLLRRRRPSATRAPRRGRAVRVAVPIRARRQRRRDRR